MNALKMIIDAHDVSQHVDFSGYFEDVTSVSLQSLNVLHLLLPPGGILTGFGALSGRNLN